LFARKENEIELYALAALFGAAKRRKRHVRVDIRRLHDAALLKDVRRHKNCQASKSIFTILTFSNGRRNTWRRGSANIPEVQAKTSRMRCAAARYGQKRSGRQRRQGKEPRTSHRDWSVESAKERQEGFEESGVIPIFGNTTLRRG
jgi:hypothetical protein